MSRIVRLRLVAVDTPRQWYACVEYIGAPLVGGPLGRVSDHVACAVLLSIVFSRAHLSRVASRMVVPELPAGMVA